MIRKLIYWTMMTTMGLTFVMSVHAALNDQWLRAIWAILMAFFFAWMIRAVSVQHQVVEHVIPIPEGMFPDPEAEGEGSVPNTGQYL